MVDFIIQEDEVSFSLREKGFFLGALLHEARNLKIDEEGMSNSQSFLIQEMLRLNNLFILFNERGLLPLKKEEPSTVTDVVIPLLRVSLEGIFRVRYLFCEALRSQCFDLALLDERFSKIVDNFSFQYETFAKEEGIAKLDIPALKREKGVKKRCDASLWQIRQETVAVLEDLDAGEDSRMYAFYRYCCFYAHGNLNAGILKEVGLEGFVVFDLNFILEGMANNYLQSFSIMFKGNPLQQHIKKALSKSFISNLQ